MIATPHAMNMGLVMNFRGLSRAGHEVELIDLAADGFNPVMTREDLAAWRLKTVVDPLAADYQRRVMEADHLIFAFPIWWESMPAATKGFLDKVLTKGVVYIEPERPGLFINGIKNIQSVSLITVMSTPSFLYRLLIGNPLPKIMFRGTFRKIGVKKLRWFSFVDPAGKTLEARQQQLRKLEDRLAATNPGDSSPDSAVVGLSRVETSAV